MTERITEEQARKVVLNTVAAQVLNVNWGAAAEHVLGLDLPVADQVLVFEAASGFVSALMEEAAESGTALDALAKEREAKELAERAAPDTEPVAAAKVDYFPGEVH